MTAVKKWMNHKKLKLNEEKTECLIVGKKGDLQRLNVNNINILGKEFDVTKPIRNLGVTFDKSLTFRDHINHITNMAGYHLHNLSFLKKYVDQSVILKLVHNFVISRLDYCNSLYYGLPSNLLLRLQRVQFRAVRLIKGLSLRDRITPALIELHWLPIRARIIFKICTLAFQAMKFEKPQYIRNLLRCFSTQTSLTLRHEMDVFRLIFRLELLRDQYLVFLILFRRTSNRAAI